MTVYIITQEYATSVNGEAFALCSVWPSMDAAIDARAALIAAEVQLTGAVVYARFPFDDETSADFSDEEWTVDFDIHERVVEGVGQ